MVLNQTVHKLSGVSHFTHERVLDLLNGRIGVTLSLMAGVLVV